MLAQPNSMSCWIKWYWHQSVISVFWLNDVGTTHQYELSYKMLAQPNNMNCWIKYSYVGTTQQYKLSDKMMWAQPNSVSCQIKWFQHHSATWWIWTVWTFCHLQVIGFCTFCMFNFLLCRQPVSLLLHISGCNKLHHLSVLGMWRSKSFGIFIVITFLLRQCNW